MQRDYGFLTGFFRWWFEATCEIPSRFFLGRRSRLTFKGDSQATEADARRRSHKVDIYVCAWIGVEALCIAANFFSPMPRALQTGITILMFLRIYEIFTSNVNYGIFRAGNNPTISQVLRFFVLTIINYGELWLCFAALYGAHRTLLLTVNGGWDVVYFSGTTQLTIGYGDLLPRGWLRFAALLQGWMGTMFLLLILGRLLGAMPLLRELQAGQPLSDERLKIAEMEATAADLQGSRP